MVAGSSRFELVNFERLQPLDANHAPEAVLIHSYEAEAFQCHSIWIVWCILSIHKLICWYPFCPGTGKLPEVLVVLVRNAPRCLAITFLVAIARFGLVYFSGGLTGYSRCHELVQVICFSGHLLE